MADRSTGMAGIIIAGCDGKLFSKQMIVVKLILLLLFLFNLWGLKEAWFEYKERENPESSPVFSGFNAVYTEIGGGKVAKGYRLTTDDKKVIVDRAIFKLREEVATAEVKDDGENLTTEEVVQERLIERLEDNTGQPAASLREEISEKRPPQEKEAVVAVPEIEALENPFILLAVSRHNDDGRAIIINIFNNRSHIVGARDIIDGFTVETILKDQVILSKGGRQISVTFEKRAAGGY